MKREIIMIDEYGQLAIPVDSDKIWMTELELAELFGAMVPTIKAACKLSTKVASCGNPRRNNASDCRMETEPTLITSK